MKITIENLKKEYTVFSILFIFFVLLLDIWTKYLAVLYINPFSQIEVWGEFFQLTLIFNTGFVFGIYQNSGFLSTFTTFIAIIFLFFYRVGNEDNASPWGWNLVMGGALGNLVDKFLVKIPGIGFRFGFKPESNEFVGVVDFLDFDWPDYLVFDRWPSFNLADSCVSVGLVILLLTMKKKDNESPK